VDKNRRILITGSEGFIGTAIRRALCDAGYEVKGIDCHAAEDSQAEKANLLNPDETSQAIRSCMPFSVLIHTAALAHGRPANRQDTCCHINTEMTRNVLRAVEGMDVRLVFFSSVAVYGEDKRTGPVTIDDDLRPSTDYGRSKVECERLLGESSVRNSDILRLAPVYDESHMKDVRKRVYLPGPLPIKLRFRPSPQYSLCKIDTVTSFIVRLLGEAPRGRAVYNVADAKPYDQNELSSWFPGRSVPLPVGLVQPLYYMLGLLPGPIRYSLRCVYWKLLKSNVYQT
jgi:UDP-glucose 4-epimerase